MKRLKVEGPASPEAIEAAYRASCEQHARERLLAIRLGQQGKYTLQEIGDILGRGRATIARWVQAYRAGGIEGLLERRHQGSAAGVSEELQQRLVEGLRGRGFTVLISTGVVAWDPEYGVLARWTPRELAEIGLFRAWPAEQQ